ncbi:MAG: orotate phosphoribosyltransferase [Bacteroidota bacterium]
MNQTGTKEKVAQYLLEIQAVKLNVTEPFTWASGLKSPIYCDNRRILSFPEVRKDIRKSLAQKVREHFPGAEVIAGVATGAIAHGVLVAEELNLPFVYVRSSQKEHGLGNQIEGHLPEGKKVVVIEDLVSTGQSSLAAVDALINARVEVLGMIAIFTYGLDSARQNMESAKCTLYTLTDFNTLIQQAVNMGVMHHSSLESLEQWRENPKAWK